jgi:hypothetical protein
MGVGSKKAREREREKYVSRSEAMSSYSPFHDITRFYLCASVPHYKNSRS